MESHKKEEIEKGTEQKKMEERKYVKPSIHRISQGWAQWNRI